MTATDELRRLLDGRGVEWGAEESELDHVTTWNANGGQAMFYESKTTNPNLLQVNYYDLTPAQAVEATLGSDIKAENEKLRELCADLYDHAAFSIDYFGDAHGILPRMRELGIEVDE